MLCKLHMVHRPEIPTGESTKALLMQGKLKLLQEAATTSKDSSWFVKCVVAMRSICDQNALRPESSACARAPHSTHSILQFTRSQHLPDRRLPATRRFKRVTSKCAFCILQLQVKRRVAAPMFDAINQLTPATALHSSTCLQCRPPILFLAPVFPQRAFWQLH